MAMQLRGKPTPLAQHRPDLPGGLLDLIYCCLSRDPALRPSSAAEVLAILELEFPPSLDEQIEEVKARMMAILSEAKSAKQEALARMKQAAEMAAEADDAVTAEQAPAPVGLDKRALFPSISASVPSPEPASPEPPARRPEPVAAPPVLPLEQPDPSPEPYPEDLASTVILPEEQRVEQEPPLVEEETLDYYDMDDDLAATIVNTRKDPSVEEE